MQIICLTTGPPDRQFCPLACRTRPLSWSRGGCTHCSSCCPLGGAPAKERQAQKKNMKSFFLFCPTRSSWCLVERKDFQIHTVHEKSNAWRQIKSASSLRRSDSQTWQHLKDTTLEIKFTVTVKKRPPSSTNKKKRTSVFADINQTSACAGLPVQTQVRCDRGSRSSGTGWRWAQMRCSELDSTQDLTTSWKTQTARWDCRAGVTRSHLHDYCHDINQQANKFIILLYVYV